MIKVKGLKKSFQDNQVLKHIDMSVEEGNIYGLIGSNGCGKTTILKHLLSIYTPDAGEIIINGKNINDISNNLNIYFVQDELFFPTNHTLDELFDYENLMYPNMSEKKFEALKSFFKMPGDKKLRQLSKGQKKQAAFILAISSGCKVLLLDEIVDGLDAVIRKKFWEVLLQEVMDQKLTVVISSHALTELDNICDKVGIIHQGEVVKEESMESLKDASKRVQFALEENFEKMDSKAYALNKLKLIGKVHFAVVTGDVKAFENDLRSKYQVILFEVLEMNLEEVFISELGGLGYGNEVYSL
jgi:ABC-2 type transport system ATP-binding protein